MPALRFSSDELQAAAERGIVLRRNRNNVVKRRGEGE
ncbi:hypothetical protein V1277_001937 [Bradyrhizobium sp. AZCC 1588]